MPVNRVQIVDAEGRVTSVLESAYRTVWADLGWTLVEAEKEAKKEAIAVKQEAAILERDLVADVEATEAPAVPQAPFLGRR